MTEQQNLPALHAKPAVSPPAHVRSCCAYPIAGTAKSVIAVLTQCLPYVGFPRAFNALSCLNEIVPEEK